MFQIIMSEKSLKTIKFYKEELAISHIKAGFSIIYKLCFLLYLIKISINIYTEINIIKTYVWLQ